MRRASAAVALLLMVSALAVAHESHLVSGTISGIEGNGTLYVVLVDRDRWDDPTGEETDEGYAQGSSEEVHNRGTITYSFEDVPPGVYAIRAFIDTNDNKELDMGLLGPSEPWGVYHATQRIVGPPRFDELSFDVESDIRDADFELH